MRIEAMNNLINDRRGAFANRISDFDPKFTKLPVNEVSNDNSIGPLKKVFNDINSAQIQAENSAELFATGQTDSIHRVIIDMEEAMLSMKLATQVRNKAIEAYQDIMRMQI